MVRGAGKFKLKRGGGRSFSRNLTLDENGTAVSMDRRRGDVQDDDEDDEDEEEEDDEDEEDEEGGPEEPEATRAERRELKKKQAAEGAGKAKDEKQDNVADGDGDEDALDANPNHLTKKLNISDLSAPRELTRREREQKEKQEAKERYWKLHVQGKTDEAKADLTRLAKIRAEREAAATKRKAEAEEKARVLAAAKAAQSSKR